MIEPCLTHHYLLYAPHDLVPVAMKVLRSKAMERFALAAAGVSVILAIVVKLFG